MMSIFFKSVQEFFKCFFPLFVAMDVFAVVPLFLGLTYTMETTQKKKLITDATLAALAVSILFLISGKLIFRFIGITEDDFRIGGGLVLLVFAISDLLFSHNDNNRSIDSSVGIVPIGIPLIMGPAALTTILILVDSFGYLLTLLSLLANLAIVWLVFRHSQFLVKIIGKAGLKVTGKIAALFLAAIAVMMIRVGVHNAWGS